MMKVDLNEKNVKESENLSFNSANELIIYFVKKIGDMPVKEKYTKVFSKNTNDGSQEKEYEKIVIPKNDRETILEILNKYMEIKMLGKRRYFINKVYHDKLKNAA